MYVLLNCVLVVLIHEFYKNKIKNNSWNHQELIQFHRALHPSEVDMVPFSKVLIPLGSE